MGNVKKIKAIEKIGYVGACVSMSIMLMFVPTFITIYYTDIVGLSAGTVGLVILLCKITDGISDILMGIVIDKTHSKWGKARPWILAGGVGSAVSLFLLFNEPSGLSKVGAIAFCAATYFLVCPLFGTIVSVAQTSIVPMITSDERERSIYGLIASFSLIIVTLFVSIITPILISSMGENRTTYFAVSGVYMVVSIISAIVAFIFIKEHETLSVDSSKEDIGMKEALSTVAKNRHFIFLALGVIFYNTSLVTGGTTYYAKYILGDVGQVAFLTLCSAGTYFLLFFALKLREKFLVRDMLVAGFIISALGCIVLWFANDNMMLVGIGILLKGVGVFPVMAYGIPFTGVISDYTAEQMGKRADGLIYSGYSMGGKVGTGLGTAILGWVMGAFGYNGMTEVQSELAITGIRFANSFVPLIFCILAAISFGMITIEKRK